VYLLVGMVPSSSHLHPCCSGFARREVRCGAPHAHRACTLETARRSYVESSRYTRYTQNVKGTHYYSKSAHSNCTWIKKVLRGSESCRMYALPPTIMSFAGPIVSSQSRRRRRKGSRPNLNPLMIPAHGNREWHGDTRPIFTESLCWQI
jgi:hypothetical protein